MSFSAKLIWRLMKPKIYQNYIQQKKIRKLPLEQIKRIQWDRLKNLLTYDLSLINSDSLSYQQNSFNYFNYLKSVDLDYSAYKLIFHNSRIKLTKNIKDSLIATIEYDSLTLADWENMDDNRNGWISWIEYHDPNRYYGP